MTTPLKQPYWLSISIRGRVAAVASSASPARPPARSPVGVARAGSWSHFFGAGGSPDVSYGDDDRHDDTSQGENRLCLSQLLLLGLITGSRARSSRNLCNKLRTEARQTLSSTGLCTQLTTRQRWTVKNLLEAIEIPLEIDRHSKPSYDAFTGIGVTHIRGTRHQHSCPDESSS